MSSCSDLTRGGAGCGKPEFFIKKKALFEVHTETGMLYNTDGGTPMVPIGEEDLPAPGFMSSAPGGLGDHEAGAKCRVFQGGFYQDLHKMLDISSGGEARPTQRALSDAHGRFSGVVFLAGESSAHEHCSHDKA